MSVRTCKQSSRQRFGFFLCGIGLTILYESWIVAIVLISQGTETWAKVAGCIGVGMALGAVTTAVVLALAEDQP